MTMGKAIETDILFLLPIEYVTADKQTGVQIPLKLRIMEMSFNKTALWRSLILKRSLKPHNRSLHGKIGLGTQVTYLKSCLMMTAISTFPIFFNYQENNGGK